MPHRLFIALAWLAFAAIVFVTVAPIGLRPITTFGATIERFAAFALLSGLFVLAYPRHWQFALGGIVLFSAALELAQLLAPGRHAGLRDVLWKSAGACLGALLALAFNRLVRR